MGKKQHYVPQTLLRNWSSDGQSIHVYQLDLDEFIETAPIDSQAQKHYYYGEDQKIENLLSTLEGEASTIIRKILQGDRELTREDKRCLICFVAMQNIRTPKRIQKLDDEITELAKRMLNNSGKIKDTAVLDKLKVEVDSNSFWQLRMFLQTFIIYADLRFAFLISNESNKFVIGQDPIVITNKLLEERHWKLSKQGLIMKGLTVFLPLSPTVTLCMYDNSTYRFVGDKLNYQLNDEEIDILNYYQFCNTENSIYYLDEEARFTDLKRETDEYRKQSFASALETPIINDKQIITTGSKDYPKSPVQSFLVIKEQAWKLPLTYECLRRPTADNAINFLKQDPKFAVVFAGEGI